MAEHLSAQLLEGYRKRHLEPAQLLALDDHVMTCAECRQILRESKPRREALISLRESLESAFPADKIAAS